MRWIRGGNGSYLHEGQLWGWGGVVGSVGCMVAESLHVESRERISNGIERTRDVLCRYSKVITCSNEK